MKRPSWPTATLMIGILLLVGLIFLIVDSAPYQATSVYDGVPMLMSAYPIATDTPSATLTATPTATVTWTPTLTTPVATLTAHAYLPYIRKWAPPTPTPTPTVTPTPTATPTPVPVEFAGTTDQGEDVTLVTTGNLSTVTELQIPVTVMCEGGAVSHSGFIPLPEGLPIADRQFEIRLWAGRKNDGEPAYHRYSGEFDVDFSTVQGTWRRWRIVNNQPICDNAGTWSASQLP